ncbi:hypothetical protein AHF37_01630 [Paragonimus kellicotti]|nr:hypothetical protein AHF37_01630 [Paragonimus kellicotti]
MNSTITLPTCVCLENFRLINCFLHGSEGHCLSLHDLIDSRACFEWRDTSSVFLCLCCQRMQYVGWIIRINIVEKAIVEVLQASNKILAVTRHLNMVVSTLSTYWETCNQDSDNRLSKESRAEPNHHEIG